MKMRNQTSRPTHAISGIYSLTLKELEDRSAARLAKRLLVSWLLVVLAGIILLMVGVK